MARKWEIVLRYEEDGQLYEVGVPDNVNMVARGFGVVEAMVRNYGGAMPGGMPRRTPAAEASTLGEVRHLGPGSVHSSDEVCMHYEDCVWECVLG